MRKDKIFDTFLRNTDEELLVLFTKNELIDIYKKVYTLETRSSFKKIDLITTIRNYFLSMERATDLARGLK